MLFVAVLAFGTASAHHHDSDAANRKKVAVVLSGGGAKGMAHIGVLKVFTLQPMFYGRLLFGTTVPPVFCNTIGGDWFGHYLEQQMPFAGVGNMEYVDNQFVAAQLQGQLHIGGSSYVLLRASAAQQSNQLKELLDYHTLLGGQMAYYYNTPFGPAGATVGYSNRTKSSYIFVNLGYEF